MAKVGDELRRRRVETARSGDVSEPRQRKAIVLFEKTAIV